MVAVDRTSEFRAAVGRRGGTLKTSADNTNNSHNPSQHVAREIGRLLGGVPVARDLTRLEAAVAALSRASVHDGIVAAILEARLATTAGRFRALQRVHADTMRAREARRRQLGVLPWPAMAAAADTDADTDGLSVTIAMPPPPLRLEADEERASQVRALEAQMGEVHAVFRRLAEVVATQTEQIQRIEDNVELAQHHAATAEHHLQRYLLAVAGDRWLLAKIFALLLFFLGVFLVFFL